MEFIMTGMYVATVAAAIVTTSLAMHVLVVRASGATIPASLARLRSGFARLSRGAKNLLDDWIAASIARRERKAAMFMLHRLGDRELSDMGLDRGRIAQVGSRFERNSQDRIGGRRKSGRPAREAMR
jgi:uncharacterized protein YjiS (DUF1127 family)